MAAESAPPEQMATAIGWVQTAQRLGPALGPVIGGTLAQALGLRQSFLVSAAFYLAAFLLVVVGYREPDEPPRGRREPAPHVTFAELRRVPHFLLFMATVFGLQLVDRSFGPILPLYLREIGVGADRVPFLAGCCSRRRPAAAASAIRRADGCCARWPPAQLVPAMAAIAAVGSVRLRRGRRRIGVLLAAAVVFGFGTRRRDDVDLHGGDARACRSARAASRSAT